MPYANKADKAAQMRRYRARKKAERAGRVYTQRSSHVTLSLPRPVPQRPVVPRPSQVSAASLGASAASPINKVQRIADIPQSVLDAAGIVRQGSNLNAPVGIDLNAFLRKWIA